MTSMVFKGLNIRVPQHQVWTDLYNNKLAKGMGGGFASGKFGSYPKPNLVASHLNCDGMGEAYWCPSGPYDTIKLWTQIMTWKELWDQKKTYFWKQWKEQSFTIDRYLFACWFTFTKLRCCCKHHKKCGFRV